MSDGEHGGMVPPVSEIGEASCMIEASDGHGLHLQIWEAPKPSATLVFTTGVMSHSGWLRDVARLVAQRGFRVVGADRRGSGSTSL